MTMILGGLTGVILANSSLDIKSFQGFYFSTSVYLFKFTYEMSEMSCVTMILGGDKISLMLVMLSSWLIGLMVLSSVSISMLEEFKTLLSSLFFALMLCFMSLDLMLFYISFELVLIPSFFLILGYGTQPERLEGGVYMLLYTLFGSLPLLVMLVYYKTHYHTFSFMWSVNNYDTMKIMFPYLYLLAFLMKLPMYLFHLWLPKAHVEAPISGSMILAGVLLKLGGYGMLRILPYLTFGFIEKSILVGVGLWGSIMTAFGCLCQLDMKKFVAYSSISHMSLLLSSLVTEMYWTKMGVFMMMSAHGFCSSAMFCMVNILYERSYTRSMLLNKGILIAFPSLVFWWFLYNIINMGAPPFLNLMSELILITTLCIWNMKNMYFIVFILFMSVCYSMYFYSMICHGLSIYISEFKSVKVREFYLLYLHLAPSILLTSFMNIFI